MKSNAERLFWERAVLAAINADYSDTDAIAVADVVSKAWEERFPHWAKPETPDVLPRIRFGK